MKRILLDTNIYISAIFFGGKPKELIELAKNKEIEIVISQHILWEIREVLSRKFNISEFRINVIEHDILSIAKVVVVFTRPDIGLLSPGDNEILACAKDGKADIIITGDNHLLKLQEFDGIKILTPAIFLKRK